MKRSICCLLMIMISPVYASDVGPLLNLTGLEFRKAFEAVARDSDAIQRLRSSSIKGNSSSDLRTEIMRRLVLARVDVPGVFTSFDEMFSLIRRDSPVTSAEWWDSVAQSGAPDVELLHDLMHKWMEMAPGSSQEWVNVIRETTPVNYAPDPKRMENRYWPPIVYGLSAESVHHRARMRYPFRLWAINENHGEVQLEALLWLCERTDFDADATQFYRMSIRQGFELPGEKTHLVTRCLNIMEDGDKFRIGEISNPTFYLNSSEKFGNASHGPMLRRLAAMPSWSNHKTVMLEIAGSLEANSLDKSRVVTRQLASMESATKFSDLMIGYQVPAYLDDAVTYGKREHAETLRKLAVREIWARYRDRMNEVADKLEKISDSPKTR